MSLKNHAILAEDVKARNGNHIWVIPKTVVLGGLSTSIPQLPVCGWLLVSHARFIVLITRLESAFRIIRVLLASLHHGSNVTRLVSSSYVNFAGGLVYLVVGVLFTSTKERELLCMMLVSFLFVRCSKRFFNELVHTRSHFYGARMLSLVIITTLPVFIAVSLRSVRLLHSLQRVFLIYRLTRRAKNSHKLLLHFLLLSLLLQFLSLSMVVIKTCSSHGSASVSPGWLGLLLH